MKNRSGEETIGRQWAQGGTRGHAISLLKELAGKEEITVLDRKLE